MEGFTDLLMRNFLLCIDGEQWTEKATTYAIDISRAFNGKLTALHVISPYLKKFADEIYAVGRREYCNYIDKQLSEEAERIIIQFRGRVQSTGLSYDVIVRYGTPEEEIVKETLEHEYDLLILGVKPFRSFRKRISSFNLPLKIFRSVRVPAMFV